MNGLRLQVAALTGELRRTHDVRLVGFRLPDQRASAGASDWMELLPRAGAAGPRDAGTLLRAIARRRPLRADTLAARMREPVLRRIRDFDPDVVHVTSGRLAGLGELLAGRPAVLAALDAAHRNVEARASAAHGLRRALLRGECRRVRRFEATDYGRFRRVVVVTDGDRNALLEASPDLEVVVIPNGVDAEHFAPDGSTARDPGLIVMTGAMHYPPNVEAARFLVDRVLPRVRRRVPGARVAIVGRAPAPEVRALGSVAGVEVTGEVPDLRPWLARGAVYACPMLGGTGIKNKLLEAMASGIACVATPLAASGLSATPGRDLVVAEGEDAFADELVRVLGDAGLASRLGTAGRDAVRSEHGWGAVARAYEQVYRDVVASVAGAPVER
jgi:glycosyltransferase involved in cell wall biosynthesis